MADTFAHGYALLIGIGESAYPKLSLPVTVKDIQALHAVLIDPALCAYPNDAQHIRLLHDKDATRNAIMDGLRWLQQQSAADPQATVIVYYSGHGWLEQTQNRYYLLQHDIDPFDLSDSALAATEFTDALRQIQAQRLLVIIDSCHAAGMATSKAGQAASKLPPGFVQTAPPKGFIDELKQGKGRVVFTSSQGEESSWVRPDGSMSVYTYHFLEALQGAANKPGDTVVRVSNLMNYLGEKVSESARIQHQAKQTPHFDFTTEDFAIALLRGGKGLPSEGWDAVQPQATQTIHQIIQNIQKVDQRGKYNVNVGWGSNVTTNFDPIRVDSRENERIVEKGYEPLPGQGQPLTAAKYVCPEPGCNYTWSRRSVGQPIPECPNHRVPLVPVNQA